MRNNTSYYLEDEDQKMKNRYFEKYNLISMKQFLSHLEQEKEKLMTVNRDSFLKYLEKYSPSLMKDFI